MVRVRGTVAVIIGTGLVLFVLGLWRFRDSGPVETVLYVGLFWVLLVLSIIDLREYRLPDRIVLPSIAIWTVSLSMLAWANDTFDRLQYAFIGALVYFGVLLIAHLVSPRGMGFGDVKLAGLLGLAVGWLGPNMAESIQLVLWAMLLGFISGSIAGIVLLVIRRRNVPFPFGPFLAFGTIAIVLLSTPLVGS
jgi:leader peptidase (prepilin peptidase)/N-methyltransferase